MIRKLDCDAAGATLIEHTVLLGILLAANIASVGFVGRWVAGQWTALSGALPE
ncbi:Flp family type IVb pilin [Bradyrhizobium erythrophlei]|uniref:Flp family type IVb pilin n=1 Tax=Bradyrhizobium erythrophlei TaxID=1437360 RepID=UPI0035EE3CF3